MIEEIKIYSLFEVYDVELNFEDRNYSVFIGENGIGKTNILNIIHCVLTGNSEKMLDTEFEKIDVKFEKQKYTFTKNDILTTLNIEEGFRRLSLSFRNHLSGEDFNILKSYLDKNETIQFIEKLDLLRADEEIPERIFRRFWEILSDETEEQYEYKVIYNDWIIYLKVLNKNRKKVIYFPTYRRIEEDLRKIIPERYEEDRNYPLGRKISKLAESNSVQMLNSGMEDVKGKFRKLEEKIKAFTVDSFNQVTGDMLTYLFTSNNEVEEKIFDDDQIDHIQILLNRISDDNLNSEIKRSILENVTQGEVLNEGLQYFINRLILHTKEQELIENKIKRFVKLCNKYLVKISIVYDEIKIKLFVEQNKNKKIISLDKLSSGEKQIISMFTLIFLDEESEEFILLIDEPELSLSLFWQETLLPDILTSENCNYLIAVTHSPFIYNNLDKNGVQNLEKSYIQITKGDL